MRPERATRPSVFRCYNQLGGCCLEVDEGLAAQALQEALERYPDFAEYGPRLEWRALMQGGAFVVQYRDKPPREAPNAWDFQNAVVKRYKSLAAG